MSKKLKLTLAEMIAYVEEHNSWLYADQREWFVKIKDFYIKNNFLSPKQRAVLIKFACRIQKGLDHSSAATSMKRVSYQAHKDISPRKDKSYKSLLGKYGSEILMNLLEYQIIFGQQEITFLRRAQSANPTDWTEETCKEIHRLAVILHESGVEQNGYI